MIWHDPSTAPRDGTPFLGFNPKHGLIGLIWQAHQSHPRVFCGQGAFRKKIHAWTPITGLGDMSMIEGERE